MASRERRHANDIDDDENGNFENDSIITKMKLKMCVRGNEYPRQFIGTMEKPTVGGERMLERDVDDLRLLRSPGEMFVSKD